MANTFPPKFDQSIRYPATQNLDELPMPQADYPLGVYFNITFPGYPANTIPILTYGKHKFDISVVPMNTTYTTEGYNLGTDIPALMNRSRILFEFKDSAGTIIFSDFTPIHKSDGFTGYVWIKQDPLRTYDDIKEGTATLSIVGMTHTTDTGWRNRFNTRTTKNIDIDLTTSEGEAYFNESPLMMQFSTSSMGSGSGLNAYEVLEPDSQDPDVTLSRLYVSASKMKTYSGEVSRVKTYIKVSGSVENPTWELFGDHPLSSSTTYEDDISNDYSQGINPLSEEWKTTIPADLFSEENLDRKVKFKFEFVNPYGQTAIDYDNPSQDYILYYPNLSDEDATNGWLNFQGGTFVLASDVSIPPGRGYIVARTANGQFSFRSDIVTPGAPIGGGQKFGSDGRLSDRHVGGETAPQGSVR